MVVKVESVDGSESDFGSVEEAVRWARQAPESRWRIFFILYGEQINLIFKDGRFVYTPKIEGF